jgi:polyisoprenoid-binding protein YceI
MQLARQHRIVPDQESVMKLRSCTILLAAALGAAATTVHADWQLDAEASSLYYVTSKAAAVSEINSFATLNGGIDAQGRATLGIDLASVQTNIEIRDQRMREIVFQTEQFPQASVTLQVDAAALAAMAPGSSVTTNVEATLELHGVSQSLPAELQIIKLDADSILVHNSKPLLVAAGSFGLAEGVEQLREIAGLPSINPNVVVDFTLVYHQR